MRLSNPFVLGTDTWDPSHRFETSWLFTPWILFAIRATFSFYAFFTSFFHIGWEATHESAGGLVYVGQSFSYFTVLTYWGLAFYFLVSAAHTFTYARTGVPLLDSFPRSLQALHGLYHTTVTTYPFIVSVVYWGIIYPGVWYTNAYDRWSNLSEHGMNSAFALFELLFTRVNPAPWVHLPFCIVLLALYCGLAYVTVATEGFYTYTFLDPAENGAGMVVAYVFGILVGIIVVFSVVKGVAWTRRWVTESKMGMTGKFSGGRGLPQVDVELLETRGTWEK